MPRHKPPTKCLEKFSTCSIPASIAQIHDDLGEHPEIHADRTDTSRRRMNPRDTVFLPLWSDVDQLFDPMHLSHECTGSLSSPGGYTDFTSDRAEHKILALQPLHLSHKSISILWSRRFMQSVQVNYPAHKFSAYSFSYLHDPITTRCSINPTHLSHKSTHLSHKSTGCLSSTWCQLSQKNIALLHIASAMPRWYLLWFVSIACMQRWWPRRQIPC